MKDLGAVRKMLGLRSLDDMTWSI